MKKIILAYVLAVVSLSSMAQTSVPEHGTYQIKLLKDGKERFTGVASLNSPAPFVYQSGEEVSEVTCTESGANYAMKSEQKFIGVFVQIARRAGDPHQVDVTLEDQHLVSMDTASRGNCSTLTAKTDGLVHKEIAVRLPADNETIKVPVDGDRYLLAITHQID